MNKEIKVEQLKSSHPFEEPVKHFSSSKISLKNVTLERKKSKRETEIHKNKTDIYIVLRGRGKLYYGEKIQNYTIEEADEIRGEKIKNYDTVPINPQNIVKIPAGIAHRVELKSNTMLVLVLKITTE